jgi:diadenosine tetraphosphate (Ap4A) HIT family hydrolase
MNPTIKKFGYPGTLLRELQHWVILLRPAQVTLGSLVLAAKSDASAFHQLPSEAFAEMADAVSTIETALADFTAYERINYLMLMMVDPNVHFHVIPRYATSRRWGKIDFADAGWPGVPRLDVAVNLDARQLQALVSQIASKFRYSTTV